MDVIKTLSEYIDAVCQLDKQMIRDGLGKHEVLLFRGQSDCNYEIIPSIARNRE